MQYLIYITVLLKIYNFVAISSSKYKVLNGLKISNTYKEFVMHYDIVSQCASYCLLEKGVCKSANYHLLTKVCELNLKSPLEESAVIEEDDNWRIIYIADDTWELVFRGTAGIGVEIYPSYLGTNELTAPEAGCHLTHNLNCTTHYRNSILDHWESQNIIQVKFAMYKHNEMVVNLIFNNSGTNIGWFDKDLIVNSSFTDITETGQIFNYFNIEGESFSFRRFFINKNYGGCPVDRGWMAVFDAGPPFCDYEYGHAFPHFAYMPNNTNGLWDNRDYESADVLAIFVRKDKNE